MAGEHNIALRVIRLCIQKPLAIRGNRQAATRGGSFRQCAEMADRSCAEVVEVERSGRRVVDASFGRGPALGRI